MASSTSEVRRALALVALLAAGAGAQSAPAPDQLPDAAPEPVATLPDGTRRVRGRIVTPVDRHESGVPGVWVTLHRVGSDAAGPLDSMRTDGRGAYAFTYRPRGDARAVYFVAASRGGVAYFGTPLTQAVVEGEPAEIVVFDTSSVVGKVHASGQHLIVARPGPGGLREVLEVFELANDTTVTFVPPTTGGRGVWSVPLPARATGFAARESSDLPADGLVAIGGRATLMVPVAPGLKQVAYSYRLPADAFPLRVPVAPGTGVVEVLVEDPRATAAGAGLAAAGPVALEGKTFQRFLSQNAAAGGAIDVQVAAATGPQEQWPRYAVPVILGVVGGAMATMLVATARRRERPSAGPRQGSAVPRAAAAPSVARGDGTAAPARERLLADLAALDDAYAGADATAEERAAYDTRRAAIKARLAAELAGSPGGR